MSFRFPQPSNEDAFELFCLRFLRELWRCPTLQQYGKRGERQFGIDLIDEGGRTPLRGVQCKHHEPDKTIPPAEIEGEVTQALGSGLPLDEYHLLTTARKTTHAQNAVIHINRDHRVAGRFKVFVWTWADVEEQLSQMDDATADRVLRGDTGRGGPAMCRLIAGVMTDHFDRPLYAAASAIDLELDAAKGLIDRHELEVATAKLTELEARAAGNLQPHHRYELKALRSRILSARWEWEAAGRELLDAKRFLPDTDRARVNEALGRELTGDRETAHALAQALRAELPHHARLAAIWVRTAPPATPLAALTAVAAAFAAEEEIHLAIAFRALVEEQPAVSFGHAIRATELAADSPQAWFVLGQATHALGYTAPGGLDRGRLREAEGHYTRAARLARDHKFSGLEGAIRLNRGKVRHLLGGNGDSDFAAAVELDPAGGEARAEYVAYLLEQGRHADALTELSAGPIGSVGDHHFYEAAARYGRNVGDDRRQAVVLLVDAIAAEPGRRWADAHALLVQAAVEGKTPESARGVIRESRLEAEHPLLFHTLCGWLAEPDGGAEYRAALALLTDSTPTDQTFLLAQALAAGGEDALALPLFQRCYRAGVFNLECRKLLGCAHRLNRHDVTSRVCRELRAAGEADPRIVLTEIQVLQQYDPQEALRVAREQLAARPTDRHLALWQSTLALNLDQPEWVISDLARLPAVDELTPEGTGLVLNVLSETGQHAPALRYAYDALREHFATEFAHGQYVTWFLRLSRHCPELGAGGPARSGAAVSYREGPDEADRWMVIEDAADPNLERNEFAPDHAVSQALVGRQVGEEVAVVDGGVQPRVVTIRDLCHKYVYRFRDCLNQFQFRFPGATAIQLVNVGNPAGDGYDFSAVVRSLEDQRRHIASLDTLYRTQPIPLVTYANWAGRDEVAAWGHLVSDPTLGVRASDPRADDLRAAVRLAADASTVVLDLTGVLALAQLDLLAALGDSGGRFAVAQTAFDRLAHLAELADDDRRSEGVMMLTPDGQLGRLPADPEQRERYANFLGSVRDAVNAHCQIIPCPQAAELEPSRRERLTEILGRPTLDSMLLAGSPGATLWTDDLVVGLIARADFKVTRVWTQAVLFDLRERRVITAVQFNRAAAQLVGWHYLGTQCDADTLVAAAEVAEWDTARWPVPQVMRTLGDEAANAVRRLAAAATAIRAVWRQHGLSDFARQRFLFAVLCGVGSVRRVRYLARLIPDLFHLHVLAADDVVGLIGYWLQHSTGLVRP